MPLVTINLPSEVECLANTPKTIVQAIAVLQRLRVLRWTIAFSGISPVERPILVELMRQTGVARVGRLPIVTFDDSISAASLFEFAQDVGGVGWQEPIPGNVIDSFYLHPQGRAVTRYPIGKEPIISVGKLMGIRITAPNTVSCRANMVCEE